jgi:hypothetical protein
LLRSHGNAVEHDNEPERVRLAAEIWVPAVQDAMATMLSGTGSS